MDSMLNIDEVDFFWPRFGMLGGASLGKELTLLSGAEKVNEFIF